VEGRDDVVGVRSLLCRIRQQLQQRRFVRDECANPVGMARDHREPGDRPAAGAEHVGGISANRIEDRDDVVGAQLGCGVLAGVVDGACRAGRT
jgi:hypothetical protein